MCYPAGACLQQAVGAWGPTTSRLKLTDVRRSLQFKAGRVLQMSRVLWAERQVGAKEFLANLDPTSRAASVPIMNDGERRRTSTINGLSDDVVHGVTCG